MDTTTESASRWLSVGNPYVQRDEAVAGDAVFQRLQLDLGRSGVHVRGGNRVAGADHYAVLARRQPENEDERGFTTARQALDNLHNLGVAAVHCRLDGQRRRARQFAQVAGDDREPGPDHLLFRAD